MTQDEHEIAAAFEAFLRGASERPTGPMLEIIRAVFGYGYADGFLAGARHAKQSKGVR